MLYHRFALYSGGQVSTWQHSSEVLMTPCFRWAAPDRRCKCRPSSRMRIVLMMQLPVTQATMCSSMAPGVRAGMRLAATDLHRQQATTARASERSPTAGDHHTIPFGRSQCSCMTDRRCSHVWHTTLEMCTRRYGTSHVWHTTLEVCTTALVSRFLFCNHTSDQGLWSCAATPAA